MVRDIVRGCHGKGYSEGCHGKEYSEGGVMVRDIVRISVMVRVIVRGVSW